MRLIPSLLSLLCLVPAVAWASEAPADVVTKVLPTPTGLVVQVGIEDGSLAIALAKAGPTVVAGIAKDVATADEIRARLLAAGVHGQATVTSIDGAVIPLDANLADVVVADLTAGAAKPELLRVLRPGGTLVLRDGATWKTEVKPRPADFDNWTHYNHDATGTNASTDRAVGPGRSLRWISGPQAKTSAGMLICDEFVLGIESDGGSDVTNHLVMRNAFNGLILWERFDIPVNDWCRYANILTRDRLYLLPSVVPGYGVADLPKGMLVLDPRTGVTIQTLTDGITYPTKAELQAITDKAAQNKASEAARDRSRNTMAILSADGTTLVQVAGSDAVALDAATGKRRWSLKAADGAGFLWPVADDGVLYLSEGPGAQSLNYTFWPMIAVQRVRAITMADGKEKWTYAWPADRKPAALINILVAKGRLVMNMRWPAAKEDIPDGKKAVSALCTIDIAGGREAYWGVESPLMRITYGGHSGSRMLAVGDKLWLTTIGQVLGNAAISDPGTVLFDGYKYGRPAGCTSFRSSPNWIFGNLTAYPLDPKAPDTPILHSAAARNACDVGSFPANGLLYITPNHCFCYPYLPGTMAFDSAAFVGVDDRDRLLKGTAGAAPYDAKAGEAWPMMLRTPDRCNWISEPIAGDLTIRWTITPAGAMPVTSLAEQWTNHFTAQGMVTGVSVAEGIAVVAAPHREMIITVDPATGKERWRTPVDGRVDSQPTIHHGLVLAGTDNGYVYALNRDTGAMVWRFRAAPRNGRIMVNGALESPWPVLGSITADGDRLYVFAGRHSDADGGLWWWVLDAATGAVRGQGRVGQDELLPAMNVYPSFQPKDLKSDISPSATNLPMLTDNSLLLPGCSFARTGDTLTPWTMPQSQKGEWGIWRARFDFGHLTPGNQGLINRGAVGFMLSNYGCTAGRIFAINGDDFVNLGATITMVHRGGTGGDQIVRLKRLPAIEITKVEGKDSVQLGSKPVWVGDSRKGAASTAMLVAGDAVIVANLKPQNLEVYNLSDGKRRQVIDLPSPVIANGLSSDDGRVFVTLTDGTVMALSGK